MKKLPARDPEGAYVRRTTAARRVGRRRCACGESRPKALIPRSKPVVCAACQRQAQGKSTDDDHHVAGVSNHPITIRVPVNDHRAELNAAQLDWPKETRENPRGSPALAGAACIRGFIDTIVYLIKQSVAWVAELLEAVDAFLVEHVGPTWWRHADLAQYAPTT